jgi:sugar phosphate isomerase/epimerase
MNYKRREFLQTSAMMAAGLAMAPLAGKLFSGEAGEESWKKSGAFGIQLWTLRDELPKDPKGVLKQLAGFGYKQVESFEGSMGMFWGMSNTEFKKYMDDLGMKIISSHCDIEKDFEKKASEAAAIGMKYLICPWKGPQKSIDDFKKFAEEFNQKGEICKKNGIRFAYHNHDYGFKAVDGQLPQDVMMQNTDASLVDFEMDIYWVVTAGEDPLAWMKKYPGRFKLGHVKDRIKNTEERDASCILGEGSIDYPPIVEAAKKEGMKYFIVEQERYDNTTELDCARADADYMKKLNI